MSTTRMIVTDRIDPASPEHVDAVVSCMQEFMQLAGAHADPVIALNALLGAYINFSHQVGLGASALAAMSHASGVVSAAQDLPPPHAGFTVIAGGRS